MKVWFAILFVGSLSIAITGCGKSGLPVVPVNGKITFSGGPPPKPGTITFRPVSIEAGLPNRPGNAVFNEQGEFQVTSFKENDGLVPGTYHATISCWMGTPSSSDPSSFERLNYVPKDFEPKPVTVGADEDSVEVIIDIPKKQ